MQKYFFLYFLYTSNEHTSVAIVILLLVRWIPIFHFMQHADLTCAMTF